MSGHESEHAALRREQKETEANLRRAAALCVQRGEEIQELKKEVAHVQELHRITEEQMKLRIEERDKARETVRKLRGYE